MKTTQIQFTDITLAQQASYTFKQRVEIAKTLDKVGVDIIRLFGIENEKSDTFAIRTICSVVKQSVVSVPCRPDTASIDLAYNAMSVAAHGELYLPLPTSVVQMEYFYQKKIDKMLEVVASAVAYAKSKCENVHFGAQDATRAESADLIRILQTALEAGATAITLCDDAATMLPADFCAFLQSLYEAIPALRDVRVFVQCRNDLSLACACALSAVQAGANGVVVHTGQDAPTAPSLSAMAQILQVKGADFALSTKLCLTAAQCAIKQLALITRQSATASAFATQAEGTVYTHSDDITVIGTAVRELGYDLSEEDLAKVYDAFAAVAKKKEVGQTELDAIVATVALQVPPTYRLQQFVINSGNNIPSTAYVEMERDGQIHSAVCTGHGSIDAAFCAIDTILGHRYELDDFQIQSVTQGSEAMGSALVRLRAQGKLYSGSGISTDIIGASIRAYVNAINKIAYEEKA